MKCPFCGATDTKVCDSRPSDDDSRIKRRRECIECGKRFTTYEVIETMPILVIKKDGSREIFDREKLIRSMLKACEKRPVTIDSLNTICDNIERTITNSMAEEVSSQDIGEMVMESLVDIDKVAYVRFASVYKDFRDVDTFLQLINNMISKD